MNTHIRRLTISGLAQLAIDRLRIGRRNRVGRIQVIQGRLAGFAGFNEVDERPQR